MTMRGASDEHLRQTGREVARKMLRATEEADGDVIATFVKNHGTGAEYAAFHETDGDDAATEAFYNGVADVTEGGK